jgi:thioredoxin-like negative regulator of GroEL
LRVGTQPTLTKTKPRLLFFYEPREGAGRRAERFLAQVLQRRRNHKTFVIHRIDVSQRSDLAERFRVTATPALLVIADGKVRTRITQPTGCEPIRQHLQPWLR